MDRLITDINQLDFNKRYTYSDYLSWQFEDMVELIRGKIFRKSPAPSRKHQQVAGRLHGELYHAFSDHSCELYIAPFDVKLPLSTQSDPILHNTVVQPDICVVCDPEKLTDQGCTGAPDWIIEILSPGTSHKDLNEKFDIYQAAGVREYWVVHPYESTVLIYYLNDEGLYESASLRPYASPAVVSSVIFPNVSLDLNKIFS